MKVVQFLVKEVNQFPSDIECMRYIATITDKVGWPEFPTKNIHGKFLSIQKLNAHVCSHTSDLEICACLLFNTALKK